MHVYPWSAVVGHDDLKQALLLCAIDPDIGGVLVHGPRGMAKTTLARALGELLPGNFVELPLGASEERVTGTLDLDAALREQRVAFSPGLLARAHEGVLYVDEVNLLPDPLVDLLLDAAASGKNVVERDGVSHVHAARFVLVGTMNPEEGELRPQLVDRFGLSVSVAHELLPSDRAEIILRRLAFDREPAAFVAGFAGEQQALVARCLQARARAAHIPLAGPGLTRVTELCHAAGVEGVRADLAMLRAARAHAAWQERDEITIGDVDAVAEFALAHRRREPSEPSSRKQSNPGGNDTSGGGSRAAGNGAAGSSQRDARAAGETTEGQTGALAPVPVSAAAIPTLSKELLTTAPFARERRARASLRRAAKGRAIAQRGRSTVHRAGVIDWFATLVRSPRPKRADLRHRVRRASRERLWIVAIDCSSSMLRAGALALAKGVAQALEAIAARRGVRLALISFQGPTASANVSTNAGRGAFMRALDALGAGGGTPLRSAIQEAVALCKRPSFRAPEVEKRLWLLTDGRTKEHVADLAVAARNLDVTVLDCERGTVRLARARNIAADLSARYLHVDALLAR